ncbi:MAG: YHS domain-containing protein [Desulfobulbus sp.]|jgi:YHS domain-containing protein
MYPLRLLVIGVLCYILWRMLRRGILAAPKQQQPDGATVNDTPQDVLVEDPVCHLLIPKSQALRMRKGGITYYFCSEHCCDQFAGEPEQGES